jgi:hypothetical protein
VNDFLLDLLLPKTDRVVFIQWAVMGVVWVIAIASVWRQPKDIRQFVLGLVMVNLGWFGVRTIH